MAIFVQKPGRDARQEPDLGREWRSSFKNRDVTRVKSRILAEDGDPHSRTEM